MSYSQWDEERVILEACKGIDKGKFLDVGSWHPTQYSNVRALWERGWHGVMVECSPMPMHVLLQAYGYDERVTLIEAAVGLDHQMVEFQITQDALSTKDAKSYKAWEEKGGFYGQLWVPQITFDDIFLQFGGGFDFISIDTEGNSCELLKALLATEVRPQCICFEHERRFAESFAHFSAAGYRVVLQNDTNNVIERKV